MVQKLWIFYQKLWKTKKSGTTFQNAKRKEQPTQNSISSGNILQKCSQIKGILR